uniref:S1/P1 nuclease, putative n=1 Tax=Babesia bovis TaxID=5865 RepID=S6BEI2_BABBO|nr:S1/P1 nuclease, putative [Babesia bovis]
MTLGCLLPLLGLFLLGGKPTLAWDDITREAIESTAMSAITFDRLRRMKVILRGHDLVDYTWWSDEVRKRIPESATLHRQLQNDETCLTFDSTCPNGLCLIQGSKFFFAKLMSSGYSMVSQPIKFELPLFRYPKDVTFTPSDCLKYLVVLLSDMHYPFNVDLAEPHSLAHRKVDLSGFPMWEALSKEKLGHAKPSFEDFIMKVYMPHYIQTNEESWYGSWTNVEVLGSRYKVEQETFNRNTWDNFEIWASETANLHCNGLVTKSDFSKDKQTIKLSDALLDRIGNTIKFQIVLAGARVAVVLNYILSHREIAYCEKTGLLIERHPDDVWRWHDYVVIMTLTVFGTAVTVGFYFLCIGLLYMFKDHVTQKVDEAIQGWKNRRKSKYQPHLEIHQQ